MQSRRRASRPWHCAGCADEPPDLRQHRFATAAERYRSADFGDADVVVTVDVLHCVDPATQEAVLRRARASLPQASLLLLRIGDASAGAPFRISNWVDRMVLMMKGHGGVKLHCRAVADPIELLDRLGFDTDVVPMSAGTPFANVLLVGRPR